MSQTRTWIIGAGEGAFRVEEFLQKGIVSGGLKHLGDLCRYSALEQIRTFYQQTPLNHKPGKFILCLGQVYRFRNQHRRLRYDVQPQDRTYSIGTATLHYEY